MKLKIKHLNFSNFKIFELIKNENITKIHHVRKFEIMYTLPTPTLNHCREDDLTQQMLVTAFSCSNFNKKITENLVMRLVSLALSPVQRS